MTTDRQAQPPAMIVGILGAAGMLGAAAYAATKRMKTRRRDSPVGSYRPSPMSISETGGPEGIQRAPSPDGWQNTSTSRQEARPVSNSIEDVAHELVSSARVEGTPVYDRDGERLGAVHSVMINKRTGQVAYALMSFGGFLGGLWGMGQRVHPLPWEMLTYDQKRHGYCVDLDRKTLEAAPTLSLDGADRPSGDAYDTDMLAFRGAARYWQHWTPPI